MTKINDLPLTLKQQEAILELKKRLFYKFKIEEIILYGSTARQEADNESDIDLLFITSEPLSRITRHKITDVIFDININFDTNFSSLVVDKKKWLSGIFSILPIRNEIKRDGIKL